MKFYELIEAIKKVPVVQLQENKQDFLGAVIKRKELKNIELLLTTFLGTPIKPRGTTTSEDIQHMSASYGGIRENQTLFYCKEQENTVSILAMLWPWSDGENITLKVIQEFEEQSSLRT